MTTSSTATDYHHKKVSRTCNLMSQFLKQNGWVRDLNLVLSPAKPHGLTTKNLLPMIEKCDETNYDQIQDLNELPPSEESTQMTIFYNGQVIVFNQFPQEKAKEIMDRVASSTTTTFGGKLNGSSTMSLANGLMSSEPLCEGDMPIMRNASLARFIAKRRDRIRARAPYQLNISQASSSSSSSSSSITTVDNRKTWLNLSSSTNNCPRISELQFL